MKSQFSPSDSSSSSVFDVFFRPGLAAPRILTASSPALAALPMATVATGMPLGICTMDSNESLPDRAEDFTGTPTTGSLGKSWEVGSCGALDCAMVMNIMMCYGCAMDLDGFLWIYGMISMSS